VATPHLEPSSQTPPGDCHPYAADVEGHRHEGVFNPSGGADGVTASSTIAETAGRRQVPATSEKVAVAVAKRLDAALGWGNNADRSTTPIPTVARAVRNGPPASGTLSGA
jgi:hypothetical protein